VARLKEALAILDVGHGNSAVLIDTKGVIVLDAGPGIALCNFLLEQGITRIDVIMVSHADQDHISGLIGILSSGNFQIGSVYLNTDSSKNTKIWDDLLYTLSNDANVTANISLTRDTTGKYDQGSVRVEILAPSVYIAGKGPGSTDKKGRAINSNSISAVVRFCKNGEPIALLAGDVDQVGLDNILEDGVDIQAPILVFPHHGGRPGTCNPVSFANDICTAVKPETVVFSVDRSKYGLPRDDVVQAVRSCTKGVRIACTQLSDRCAETVPNVDPDHLVDVYAHGRESKSCCAGTIVISLVDAAVSPSRSDHDGFISNSAPTAMCMKNQQLIQVVTPQDNTN
jgi:beta-lactamase superfamily II metal-dependent hydrolase